MKIHLDLPAGKGRYPYVIQGGIPLPEGRLRKGKSLILRLAGRTVPVQTRILTLWPDGSTKWILASVPLTPDLGTGRIAAELSVHETAPEPGPSMASGDARETSVDTGRLSLRIAQDTDFLLRDASLNGRATPVECAGLQCQTADGVVLTYRNEGIRLEEDGESLLAIILNGRFLDDKGAESGLCGEARIIFTRGSPYLKTRITLTNRGSDPHLLLRDVRMILRPCKDQSESQTLSFGGEYGEVFSEKVKPGNGYYLLQNDDLSYQVRQIDPSYGDFDVASGGAGGAKAPGWCDLSTGTSGVFVQVRNFWQEYPKEFSLDHRGLTIGLFPERGLASLLKKPLLPEPEDPWRRFPNHGYEHLKLFPYQSFIWTSRRCLEFLQGMSKSFHLFIGFHEEATSSELAGAAAYHLAAPPVKISPASYRRASGVHSTVTTPLKNRFRHMEAMLERSFEWYCAQVKLHRSYGMTDYGDLPRHLHTIEWKPFVKQVGPPGKRVDRLYHVHPRAGYWNNLERDIQHGFFLQYMRTGGDVYFTAGEDAVWHNADIDFRHFSTEGEKTGLIPHSDGHCYLARDGHYPDHNWLEGFLDYYHLTGENRFLDIAVRIKDLLLRSAEQLDDDSYEWDTRSVARIAWELSAWILESNEADCMTSVRKAVRWFAERQEPDGWWYNYWHGKQRVGEIKAGLYNTSIVLRALALAQELPGMEESRPIFLRAIYFCLSPDPAKRDGKAFDIQHIVSLEQDLAGTFKLIESLALAYELTSDSRFKQAGVEILDHLAKKQDRSANPKRRGHWCYEPRLMPYRTGNCLQHVSPFFRLLSDRTKPGGR